jgi:hypothetical protein
MFLAQLQAPITPPSDSANIIPWVVGFLGFLSSGIVWFVLKDLKEELKNVVSGLSAVKEVLGTNRESYHKKMEEEADRIIQSQDRMTEEQKKLGLALFITQRERLLQLAADFAHLPMVKAQAERMVSEIDAATTAGAAKTG